MKAPRKIRGDAKLERLRPEQKKQLLVWLAVEERTYADVAERVRAEFGVSVGKSALSCYWQRHVRPIREREEAAARILAENSPLFPGYLGLSRARLRWSDRKN